MTPSKLRMAAIATLLLGVADLLVINLAIAPGVRADRKDETVAVGPMPTVPTDAAAKPIEPNDRPDAAPQANSTAQEADAAAEVPDAAAETPDAAAETPDAAAETPDAAVEPVDTSGTDPSPSSPIAKPRTYVLYFTQNRATLKSFHRKKLDEVASRLQADPTLLVTIEGFADRSERKEPVRYLLKRRGQKPFNYLRGRGIDPSRLQIRDITASQVDKSSDQRARKQNRKVVLRLERR